MSRADELLDEGLRNGTLQVGERGEVYIMRDGAVIAVVHKDLLPDLHDMQAAPSAKLTR